MAENTFTLNVELQTNGASSGLKDLQKEIKNTANAAKDLGKGFGDALKGIDSQISGLTDSLKDLASGGIRGTVSAVGDLTSGLGLTAGVIAGVGLAAIAATAALIANASAMAALADDAAEAADKLGLTVQEYEVLNLLAEENGTTINSLVGTYDKLANSLDDVATGNVKTENAFRKLGLAQEDLANKSKEEIAGQVIRNYEALGRSVQATAAVQDILGKSFRDQVPAIKAAANEMQDYTDRVTELGGVPSEALIKAGGDQEKAFNDLARAFKETKLLLANFFTDTATDAAKWATEMVKSFNKGLGLVKEFTDYYGTVSAEEIQALRKETGFFNESEFQRRLKELRDFRYQEKQILQQRAVELSKGPDEYPEVVKPKPPKDTKETPQAKLTEDQKNVIALSNAMRTSFSELDKQLELFNDTGDAAAQQLTALAFKLFDAGKGVITFTEALAIATTQYGKIRSNIENTNTTKLTDGIKNINQGLQLQLDILSASTELQKEQVRLRAQLSKSFENQLGGPTPEQAKALEDALKNAAIQFERIANAKIGESVKNSMRDLTEQSRDLAFELTHFWDVHRDGLVNSNNALQSLYRTIDPEGRGANISKEQKDRLEAQLNFIEGQKRLIEQNKRIEESFRDLGSAVSDWALGSENGIKRVKIELIKLIALSAMRAYGSTGNSFADLFIGGVVSGLSGNRAAGGPVSAGRSYRVGEQGAETVTFGRSGYVMPKEQMSISTKSGGLVVSVNPKFENHGTINSTEDLDGYMTKWGEGVARHTEKFVREQFSASGMAYMR